MGLDYILSNLFTVWTLRLSDKHYKWIIANTRLVVGLRSFAFYTLTSILLKSTEVSAKLDSNESKELGYALSLVHYEHFQHFYYTRDY